MYRHNKKFQSLMATAKELFWKFGVRRVSIEEICKEASVSKMTFYKFFKNKEELGKKILDQVMDETIEKFQEVWESDIGMEERFMKMLELKAEGTKDISMEFIKDLYADPDSELAAYMQEKYTEISGEIIKLYKDGQKKGWIRQDLNVEFTFYLLQKMIPIMHEEATMQFFSSSQDMIMEITRFFLYGMHPKTE